MSATMMTTPELKPYPRMSYQRAAEHWRRECLETKNIVRYRDERIAKLEAENEALGDRLDVWEASAVAELKSKADAYDEVTALLADYRRFGWTDRLDEALRLATGERF